MCKECLGIQECKCDCEGADTWDGIVYGCIKCEHMLVDNNKYPLCPRCHLPLKFSQEDAYATEAGWNNILSCECGYKFVINGDGEVE